MNLAFEFIELKSVFLLIPIYLSLYIWLIYISISSRV